MLLGAWGKHGSGTAGGVPMNPTTPVIPSNPEPMRRRRYKLRYLVLVATFALYLILGASSFSAIEAPAMEAISANVGHLRTKFLARHPCVDDAELDDFLEAVVVASKHGISAVKNSSNELNWSFGQSFFFATTVVTTIGYGHVTPISDGGKVFCMVYALIGIPLLLVLLSASVERLLVPTNWVLGLLNRKLGHLYQPFNIRLLHLSVIVILLGFILLLIPSFMFAYMESRWGLLDAFYYCFISLTTIGLGDFIPGDSPSQGFREAYKIGTTLYLIVGLVGMMLILTIFYEIPQLNVGHLFKADWIGLHEEEDSEKVHCLRPDSPQRSYSTSSGLNKLAGIFMGSSSSGNGQREDAVQRSVVKVRPHPNEDDDDDYSPADAVRPIHVP